VVQGYVRGYEERRRLSQTQGIRTAQGLREAGRVRAKPVVIIHRSLGGGQAESRSRNLRGVTAVATGGGGMRGGGTGAKCLRHAPAAMPNSSGPANATAAGKAGAGGGVAVLPPSAIPSSGLDVSWEYHSGMFDGRPQWIPYPVWLADTLERAYLARYKNIL